jgi:hypothetical protein
MQQHPIPQNVTQYQFRLVGDMTLKQFLELAGGGLLAYLFFASNLIFIIKWPLVIVSFLLGAALAFFPIEDRPLDQWITNFLRAIYAPTRFIWQKTNKIPRLFLFEAHAPEIVNTITKTIKAPSLNSILKPISDLSEFEASKVSSLDSLFKELPQVGPVTNMVPQQQDDIEKPSISVRKLKPITEVSDVVLHTPAPEPIIIAKSIPTPPANPSPSTTNLVFSAPSAPKVTTTAPPTTVVKNITLPASPRKPNLITGVVVDQNEKLVENAIVQIVSNDGIPQRAMKTNSLGQFYTSTPLGEGKYIIEIEKSGLTFAPQQIIVNNTIISPIELHATA